MTQKVGDQISEMRHCRGKVRRITLETWRGGKNTREVEREGIDRVQRTREGEVGTMVAKV